MVDLIDRQAAIDAIGNDIMGGLNYRRILLGLPSTHQELVRCKDCIWYDPTHPYGTVIPDAFHCKTNDRFYKVSHFCGYGERRE